MTIDAQLPSAEQALAHVVGAHPHGQHRAGQAEMARAVAAALETGRHLLVEAGTGTGKSMAYLVPAILAVVASRRAAEQAEDDADGADADDKEGPKHRRAVIATATKALQEQLVTKDLPAIAEALAGLGITFRFAMLKGRSNYLCRAKTATAVAHLSGEDTGLLEPPVTWERQAAVLHRLARWADETATGDRADLPEAVPHEAWAETSIDARECPGASDCHFGDVCFAERARRAALGADVIVVNTHLYALDLQSQGAVLPRHDIVVFDEAHTVEDVLTGAFATSFSAARFSNVGGHLRRLLAESDLPDRVAAGGAALAAALADDSGRRVQPARGDIATALSAVRETIAETGQVLANLAPTTEDADLRRRTATRLVRQLAADLDVALDPRTTERAGAGAGGSQGGGVAWVEAEPAGPALRIAPIDIGPVLSDRLFAHATVIATSATLTVGGEFAPVGRRLGLAEGATPGRAGGTPAAGAQQWTGLAVESPFDYERQALLYCAAHLPDPRAQVYAAAMHAELVALVEAAGGRTLALFTSRAAMRAAAEALRERLDGIAVLVQDEVPRPVLLARLAADPAVVVIATQSFWQGVDVPGDAVTLVTIDKLPFPRPTDPLLQARREAATAAGGNGFSTVDLPRAAMLLAQGAGRLIRTPSDRGVVAVFDPRLRNASYAWTLVHSLPPMRRTRDREEVTTYLARCRPAGARNS